jgi:hypothetical protein
MSFTDEVIYIIECDSDPRVYIGSTKLKLERRAQCHNAAANKGRRGCLWDSMREIGPDQFTIRELAFPIVNTHVELLAEEQKWIEHYDATNPLKGWNKNKARISPEQLAIEKRANAKRWNAKRQAKIVAERAELLASVTARWRAERDAKIAAGTALA